MGFQRFGNDKKKQEKKQNQDEGQENYTRRGEPSYHSYLQSLQRRGTLGRGGPEMIDNTKTPPSLVV